MKDYTKQPNPPVLRGAREGDTGVVVLVSPDGGLKHIGMSWETDVSAYINNHKVAPEIFLRTAIIDTEATKKAAAKDEAVQNLVNVANKVIRDMLNARQLDAAADLQSAIDRLEAV